ncbi:MAG: phosphodiester glycosidase family protein [Gaiellales bacterium]
MRRLLVIVLAIAGLVPSAAATAAPETLWPGVTYERGVQFTPHGPVAISILRGPRPGGLTTLEPVLSNDTLLGRETLTSMQRRLAATSASAGVNGDYFTLATGRPSGVLMQEGVLVSPPRSGRAAAGITSDGRLDVRRVGFFGSWRGTGARHPLDAFNEVPESSGVALFTERFGPFTPLVRGATLVVLFPFPAAVPGIDLQAAVGEVIRSGSPIEIPAGGAVLIARGQAAAQLAAEAQPGGDVVVQLQLKPAWPGVVAAIGGGPQLVRDGSPVYRAGEEFTSTQLTPRAPRTGIGQLRDGRVILVTVDGRQPGLSVGLTNFELAQALARLGAVSAMALDGGGSTTMAFDGRVLNAPSDGRERPIATGLLFAYHGVFANEVPAVVSPNGDGVSDTVSLAYRLARPSTVTAKLVAPDGTVASESSGPALAGTYPIAFPPAGGAGSEPPAAGVRTAQVATEAGETPLGTWRLVVEARDDLGRATTMSRAFVLDDTLGSLRVPRRVTVRDGFAGVTIGWKLARSARVTVTITRDAKVVRRLALGNLEAGERTTVWDGLVAGRKPAATGSYAVTVAAVSEVGRSELSATLSLRRPA